MKEKKPKTVSKTVDLKTKAFNVYNHLIEYNLIGKYFYIVLLLLETFQLLRVAFSYPLESNDTLYGYIATVLGYSCYIKALSEFSGADVIFIGWIANYAIVVGTLALCGIVLLFYYTDKFSFIGRFLTKLLGALLVLHSTILYVPGAYCYMSFIFCTYADSCWDGAPLAFAIVSVIGILIYNLLLHVAVFYEDYYVASKLPWARATSRPAIIKQYLKFLMLIFLTADTGFKFASYTLPVLVLAFGVLAYYELFDLAYHNPMVNFVASVRSGTLFFSYLFVYIVWLLGVRVSLDSGILMLIAAVVLSMVLYKLNSDGIQCVIENNFVATFDEACAINAIIRFAKMEGKVDTDPETFCLFLAVLNTHREACKKSSCLCEKLECEVKEMQAGDNSSRSNDSGDKTRNDTIKSYPGLKTQQLSNSISPSPKVMEDSTQLQKAGEAGQPRTWQMLINIILEEMLERHPKSVVLHIVVAYYQELMGKNFYKSFFNLVKASEKECSYGQQLAIYRMKTLLDQEILEAENDKVNKTLELDINVFLKFEHMRRVLDFTMLDATEKVVQFWTHLSSNLKIDKMYVIGGQISTAVKKTYKTFNKIVHIFPDHIKTYIKYSEFLREVSNSEAEGNEYQDKANQIRKNLNYTRRQVFGEEGTFSVNRETAIVVVSGSMDTLGVVTNVNEYAFSIFGYTYNEMMGFSINMIIPKLVASQHDKYLIRFFESGVPRAMNREGLFFGQCKNTLLVPVTILIKTMPGLNEGLRYVAFIRRDLAYIKKVFINFPYKYNRSVRINFVMTLPDGKILGITKRTAKTLGISKEYFEKKKGLFTSTITVEHLSPDLKRGETEDELLKGQVTKLNFRPIYDVLDKDFLTDSEIEELSRKKGELEVFIQLIRYKFSSGVEYNIYAFVDLKLALGSDRSSREELKEKDSDEEDAAFDAFNDNASTTSSPSSAGNQSDKSLVKELKKNMFEQKESHHIVTLKRIIFVAVFALFALSVLDFALYLVRVQYVNDIFNLDVTSHRRRNLLATAIGEFQSYLGLALGTEPNRVRFETNRTNSLKERLLDVLEQLKDNEYDFHNVFKETLLDSINRVAVSPGTNVADIFINSSLGYSKQGLTSTVVQLAAAATKILNEVEVKSLNTRFVRTLCNNSNVKGRFSKLTQTEKDTYFVLTNGLHNTINASSLIIDYIDGLLEDTVRGGMWNYIIVHSVQLFVAILMVVASLPFIQKVQSSKREVLQLFAEIKRKDIEELLRMCDNFRLKQQRLDDPRGSEKGKYEIAVRHESKVEGAQDVSRSMPMQVSEVETQLKTTEGQGEAERRNKISNANLLDGTGAAKDKPKLEEENDNTETYAEKRFAEERKNRFLLYRAEIGLIFLILFGSVLAITGYQGGMLAFQMTRDQYFYDNHHILEGFQQRWFYMAATIVYLQATTKAVQLKDGSSSEPLFLRYVREVFSTESLIDKMYTDHPYNMDTVADLIYEFTKSDFCIQAYKRGILNKTALPQSACRGYNNRLLRYGLNMGIYYLATDFKATYLNITNGRAVAYSEVMNDKIMFERILVPAYDYLIRQASDAREYFMYRVLVELSIHFSASILVILIALVVLVKCFIGRLNNELWNAKGIVILLPYKCIEENEHVKEMFKKQMNLIVQYTNKITVIFLLE